MGVMLSENWPDALEKGLRVYVIDGAAQQEAKNMYQDIFTVKTTKFSQEKDSSASGFEDFTQFTGTVNYGSESEGYDVVYTFDEYAGGMKVERKFAADNLYNIINRRATGLGKAGKRSKDKIAVQLFNEAFTTAPTDNDAKPLCDAAHPSPVSGISTTQSNEGTSALSATSVEATRLLMRKFKGYQDELLDIDPDMLLIPLDLEETAWEIISSKGKVDTADNNKNFHYGKYKLAVWRRLSDTNNWFMLDSDVKKESLFWFDREPMQFFQDKDSDTLNTMGASNGDIGVNRDEIAGTSLELQILIEQVEKLANSKNAEDWTIRSQAGFIPEGSEAIISLSGKTDKGMVHSDSESIGLSA